MSIWLTLRKLNYSSHSLSEYCNEILKNEPKINFSDFL